jgi:hypothetical protein
MLPGIRELSGPDLAEPALRPPDWTGAEWDRSQQLAAEKDGRDGWNRKR